MQHIVSYPDPTLFRGKGSGDHGVFLIGSAKSAVLILARHALANEIIKKHILIEISRLLTRERVGSGDETILRQRML